jgi:hypothetical protein
VTGFHNQGKQNPAALGAAEPKTGIPPFVTGTVVCRFRGDICIDRVGNDKIDQGFNSNCCRSFSARRPYP